MRQKTATVNSYFLYTPFGEYVEGVRAFNVSREEKMKSISEARKSLTDKWPEVAALPIGEFHAYSPYAFLHRSHYVWNPTDNQKKVAINNLPYFKSQRFIHQKVDSRNPLVFTYIRQPGYYAAFNSGPILRTQQRFGLGLLWHPEAGTFLQSQTDSDVAAWGTKTGQHKVYEGDSLNVLFTLNDVLLTPSVGNRDLSPGTLSISYPLKNKGKKTIIFRDEKIEVAVQHTNGFSEHLPLLLFEDDRISLAAPGKIVLQKKGKTIHILFDNKAKSSLLETDLKSGEQRVVVLVIEATDNLSYSIVTASNTAVKP